MIAAPWNRDRARGTGVGEEITQYVRSLVEQPMLRRRMALHARRSVSNRSWAGVNGLLVGYYREVIAEKTGVAALGERVG